MWLRCKGIRKWLTGLLPASPAWKGGELHILIPLQDLSIGKMKTIP